MGFEIKNCLQLIAESRQSQLYLSPLKIDFVNRGNELLLKIVCQQIQVFRYGRAVLHNPSKQLGISAKA